ncbi:MAG: YhfC family glutamic-type intramembrane protease [Blautia massiliensis (ex Durand et al. 2017)]|nr:MAG: hypothetical protein DBX91_02030 [Subdoligranulum variabile]
MLGIIGAVFNVAVCLGIPVAAFVLARLRSKAGWKVFLLGVAGFFVSQIVVRQPILTLLGQVDGWRLFSAQNPAGYLLVLALTAGLAEETARFVILHFVVRKGWTDRGTPLWYGLGHGGLEAALVGVNNLLLLIFSAGVLQAAGASAALAGVERISAMMAHVGFSYLVYCGLRRKRFFVLAILLHALYDFAIVLIYAGVPQAGWEAIMFVFSVLILCGSVKIWKGVYTNENHA